jgi:deazaflavin-dependent oxidoreductase (nitroreductase family)
MSRMTDHRAMKTWTPADWDRFNDPVVDAFRSNGGRVPRRGPTLLLTTIGAQTGQPRLLPLNFTRDGDRYVVIGSKGGSPTHPAWYRNLVANPIVTLEVAGASGIETFRARASTSVEPERTRLFDAQVAVMPFFDGYRKVVTDREIPVVVFERLGDPTT